MSWLTPALFCPNMSLLGQSLLWLAHNGSNFKPNAHLRYSSGFCDRLISRLTGNLPLSQAILKKNFSTTSPLTEAAHATKKGAFTRDLGKWFNLSQTGRLFFLKKKTSFPFRLISSNLSINHTTNEQGTPFLKCPTNPADCTWNAPQLTSLVSNFSHHLFLFSQVRCTLWQVSWRHEEGRSL